MAKCKKCRHPVGCALHWSRLLMITHWCNTSSNEKDHFCFFVSSVCKPAGNKMYRTNPAVIRRYCQLQRQVLQTASGALLIRY